MNLLANAFTIDLHSKPTPNDIACFLDKNTCIAAYKALIKTMDEQLAQLFLAQHDIELIIAYRAYFFDALLQEIWEKQHWDTTQTLNLIAVGGYGRSELHPHSDIDILILSQQAISKKNAHIIETFITFLWDLNLTVGHSVRSLAECLDIARQDITVITNLIESRLLTGDNALFKTLLQEIAVDKFWPSNSFFKAKLEEQRRRHKQFNNTEYNLEPNIKECPGGLRDIQMVSWIINRHTLTHQFQELVSGNFLTQVEFDTLIAGRNYLWKVRYALHVHYQHEEDRLLFDAQKVLAKIFGFVDNKSKLAVEQFMQEYYRWALSLGELNEVLMQLFDENIIRANETHEIIDLHPDFQLVNGLIDIKHPQVFIRKPSALIEIFAISAEDTRVMGVRAQTIRAIRQSLKLIDNKFRSDTNNHRLFLRLLQAPQRVGSILKYMKRFGVLGNYIPAFGKIMGQTQHDLFHIYSVDAHTILLAMNIQKFCHEKSKEKWPLVNEVANSLERLELLYLAAIFHDIAKGRGGDHSTLGAVDALDFCRSHGLSVRDANLVSWLVKKHLLMSSVAQRKDIDDPDVIREFAIEVGDQVHLNYLFVLTVADINATNKKLWNAWRASLLRKLYKNTQRALRSGLEHYLDRENWIAEKQQTILQKLQPHLNPEQVRKIWDEPNNDYFLRESVNNIVRHTLYIDQYKKNEDAKKPLIEIHHRERNNLTGASEIFIHMPIHKNMFAVVTAALEQLDLNVHDARIYSTRQFYSMDSYYVLNADNTPLKQSDSREQEILTALHQALATPEEFTSIVKRRTPRQLKHFSMPTRTHMSTNTLRDCSVLEVTSPDRPGLLARIARVFVDYDIDIVNAKIVTLGETVEDIFFITNQTGNALDDANLCAMIQDAIRTTLDQQSDTPLTSIDPQ